MTRRFVEPQREEGAALRIHNHGSRGLKRGERRVAVVHWGNDGDEGEAPNATLGMRTLEVAHGDDDEVVVAAAEAPNKEEKMKKRAWSHRSGVEEEDISPCGEKQMDRKKAPQFCWSEADGGDFVDGHEWVQPQKRESFLRTQYQLWSCLVWILPWQQPQLRVSSRGIVAAEDELPNASVQDVLRGCTWIIPWWVVSMCVIVIDHD
mmetsp:Transcript_4169/g.8638  ORF Transcript_4169/g.8638 Transcript_4169/m.8638 type:complete len:206 (+) Transcript_4169:778-1395(+)